MIWTIKQIEDVHEWNRRMSVSDIEDVSTAAYHLLRKLTPDEIQDVREVLDSEERVGALDDVLEETEWEANP